ncbi:MAG: right-handed parallel beta-helix repeat-containing protein [Candidatus Hodarchaeales archaeon]
MKTKNTNRLLLGIIGLFCILSLNVVQISSPINEFNFRNNSFLSLDLSQDSLPEEITSDITYESVTLNINSTTNITSSGSLTVSNCNISVEDTGNPVDISLKVKAQGELSIINSQLTLNFTNSQSTFSFYLENRSKVFINHSSFLFSDNTLYNGNFQINVYTDNFTITTSTLDLSRINVDGIDTKISGCNFNRSYINIGGQTENGHESRAVIENNIFTQGSISLHGSNGNVIKNNQLTAGGILLYLSDDNIIESNIISRITTDVASGICLDASNNNSVLLNSVSFNDGNGIKVRAFSSENLVQYNTVYSNYGYGIILEDVEGIVIKDNIIYYNGLGPVSVTDSENIVFTNNTDNSGNNIKISVDNQPHGLIPILLLLGGGLVIITLIVIALVFIIKRK